MATRCLYCGAPATREDAGIPLWIVERVGLAGATVEHLVTTEVPPERRSDGPIDQVPASVPSHAELGEVQPIDRLHEDIESAIQEREELAFREYAARVLCDVCGDVFDRLDAQARPLLEPMLDGTARRYALPEQQVLAAWAARLSYTVLAIERKKQGVPRSHRRSLREHGIPHENVFVGFGRYRPNHIGVLCGRVIVPLGMSDEADVEGYTVLGVFGHMVVKVFGIHSRLANTRVKPPEGQAVRVWPPTGSEAAWPPIWSLTESHLESVFLFEPFFRPMEYSAVRYLGPNRKIKAKRKRTEGMGPHM
jgi:hypothetical protein